jgi:RNA polymerase sigma-70 factor (sigma-E family)
VSPRQDETDLERFVAGNGDRMMRVAIALTGSRPEAEDLLQTALERLLKNWQRVDTDAESYLRRTLYNLAADGWRRRVTWRRKLTILHAQDVTGVDAEKEVDTRDLLVRLLRQLPPRQRAVIVLRYWEQRTEAETAAMLGCSEGTVKSTASRGLQRLRELAAAPELPGEVQLAEEGA